MKTRILAVTVLVLALALPVALYAQGADPAAVVNAANDAWNAGDVDALKALYTDEAVVYFPDWGDKETGAEEIGAWIEDLVAANFVIEPESIEVEGETVTVVAKVWADPSRALGIAPLVTIDVYTIQGGKITNQTSTLTEESSAKLMAAMAPQEMPETGGVALPAYALAMALGGVAIVAGLGLGLVLRRSSGQTR
jgi:hypothetical protein